MHKSDPSRRLHRVWSGGALVASLPLFSDMSVSKEMYEERGVAVVHPWKLRSRVPRHALAQLLHSAQSHHHPRSPLDPDAFRRCDSAAHSAPSVATRMEEGGSLGSAELGWWSTRGQRDITSSVSSAGDHRTGRAACRRGGGGESGAAPVDFDAVHPQDATAPHSRPRVCGSRPQETWNPGLSPPTTGASDLGAAGHYRSGFHSPLPASRSVSGVSSETSTLAERDPHPRGRASSAARPEVGQSGGGAVCSPAGGPVGHEAAHRATRLALSADQAKMLLSPGMPDAQPEEAALQRAWQGEWFRGEQSPYVDRSVSGAHRKVADESCNGWLCRGNERSPPVVAGADSPEEIVRRIHELLATPGTVPEPARSPPSARLSPTSRSLVYAGAACRFCNGRAATGRVEEVPGSDRSNVSRPVGGQHGAAIGDGVSASAARVVPKECKVFSVDMLRRHAFIQFLELVSNKISDFSVTLRCRMHRAGESKPGSRQTLVVAQTLESFLYR